MWRQDTTARPLHVLTVVFAIDIAQVPGRHARETARCLLLSEVGSEGLGTLETDRTEGVFAGYATEFWRDECALRNGVGLCHGREAEDGEDCREGLHFVFGMCCNCFC